MYSRRLALFQALAWKRGYVVGVNKKLKYSMYMYGTVTVAPYHSPNCSTGAIQVQSNYVSVRCAETVTGVCRSQGGWQAFKHAVWS